MTHHADPYGINDLDSKLHRSTKSGHIRCPVRGCMHWLRPPTRKPKFAGEMCPLHGIVVHSSRTYTYIDYKRNLIVGADYFDRYIRRHPFKYEAHRFGSERSEDALSFCVFRSLQLAGCLGDVVKLCTGITCKEQPRLFLWGLELLPDRVEPWDLLIAARERFESDLPVNRPKTEPDIALHIPGQLLILIEAKFTSTNPMYQRDCKTKLLDLTLDQFVQIYHDRELVVLDYDEVRRRDRIHYQLWRNMLFAEWMARLDGPNTEPFHVNLVREGFEQQMCSEFLTLMRPEHQHRFEQISWEQLHQIAHARGLSSLCNYLETKTAGLKPAFRIKSR